MTVLLHDIADLRKLILRRAFHSHLFSPHLDLEQDPHVIDDCGNDGADQKLGILDAQRLRHNEGCGAHNRGHELSAHGAGGDDGARELLVIAGFSHQRDGKGTGGDDHCHSGAVDHAQKSRRDDCHLCGSSLGSSGHGIGDVVKELAHAALVHHFTEGDEKEDVGGGHIDRRAVDSLRVGKEMTHEFLPGVTSVQEDARNIDWYGSLLLSHQSVNDKDDRQDGKRVAADAAGRFQHQNCQQCAENDVQAVGVSCAVDDIEIVQPHIDRDRCRKSHQYPVVPGDDLPARLFCRRIQREGEDQDHCHMQGTMFQRLRHIEAGSEYEVIQGHRDCKDLITFRQCRRSKGPGLRLLIKFLQDLLLLFLCQRSLRNAGDSILFL